MTIYSLDELLSQFGTSVVPCPVLTVASWPAYRFLRRQVRRSGIPISLRIFQFVVIHRVFSIVTEAEVDVFLEFSCFLYNPMDVGNLTSGSSVFSKSLQGSPRGDVVAWGMHYLLPDMAGNNRNATLFSILCVMQIKKKKRQFKGKWVFWLIKIYKGKKP